MLAFGLTIFWGAFLLFLVQPLIARFILPWFGGGPAVWTACMLFFQVMLLAGYAYAHASITWLRPRQQVLLHLGLLALAVCLLPIAPGEAWKPVGNGNPTGHILWLLLACIGLPYLVLAATGPLLQGWFSRSHPGVSPYRLYALSNVGSLLALFAYPFGIEPHLTRQTQSWGWSAGLVVYAALAAWCGRSVWRRSESAATDATDETPEAPPSWTRRLLWLALPACGVVLLLAITNKLCQDIAVVPFLWVLPLGLYLLTFIVSFDSPRWYRRWFWWPLLVGLLGTVLWKLHEAVSFPNMVAEGGTYLATLFVGCMVCHGEVYRLRPAASRLTGYYLSLSAGGAAGGIFVALLAPLVFPHYFELHVGLFLVVALVLAVLAEDAEGALRRGRGRWAWGPLLLLLTAYGAGLWHTAAASLSYTKLTVRDFYGVLKVTEDDAGDETRHKLTLLHGGTIHGLQYMGSTQRKVPTTYYTSGSGVGRILGTPSPVNGRKVAAVGLGTGTLAAWGRQGDEFHFYEINDNVVKLAQGTFRYLGDSQAKIEVRMGDARLTLEKLPAQSYDVIVLDAFSSDAIPVHLLTLEAFATYRRHLRPGGVIAVHISNRYLDLEPVVMRAAERGQLSALYFNDHGESIETADAEDVYSSDWILLSDDPATLRQTSLAKHGTVPKPPAAGIGPWTDERSDLLHILVADEGSFLAWLQGL
jgi:spermidine synthase